MDILYFIIQQTLPVAIPLMIVALAGMFSEKSGTVNIALESIMMIGAFFGVLTFSIVMKLNINQQLIVIIGMIISGVFGLLFSLLLAYAAINMKSDQTIIGTAMNMLVPALILLVSKMFFGGDGVYNPEASVYILEVPLLSKIPLLGDLFFKKTYITVYIGLAIYIVATIFLNKTKFGLRMRACGEHPQAADSVGVNVKKMRYLGVMMSGLLAGVGGFFYAIGVTNSGINGYNGVAGYGFLAIAVMIFGQWKSSKVFFAALFFAFMQILGTSARLIPGLRELNLPSVYYTMLPYVVTLIVLMFTSKSSKAPKAAGQIYDVSKR
ncbi:MAG: ABC transporter permease [Acholeplasma sp.]|nr:ABC transporter permease [Acholeplasma sp.]